VFDEEENELAVQDFSVEKSQILNLYPTMAKDIADRINVALSPQEEKLLAEARTVDLEAYDAYLKGFQYTGDYSLESLNKAREFYNSAIEKDPDWAPLYSGLAGVWLYLQHLGFESPSVAAPKIYENLNKAFELDPDLPDAHRYNAAIAHWTEWDWEKSEKEFIRALAINPNDATSRIWYAMLLETLQRTEEALMQGQLAFELDPLNPLIKLWYGGLLIWFGDCETALALTEEVLAVDPEHFLANETILSAAFECGDYDRSFEAEKNFLKKSLGFEKDIIKNIERIYDEQGFSAANEEIAHQYELFAENNQIGFLGMAQCYVKANQTDKAMDWIEWGFEIHDPQMIYITVYPFEPLYDNPRFIKVIEKMNLPLP
jgi:tetratricopeptide (TPR) repeat protein